MNSAEDAQRPRNLAQEAEQAAQQVAVYEQAPISRNLEEELQQKSGDLQEVTGLQRAGLGLVHKILWAIFAAILIIGAAWVLGGPVAPAVPVDEEGAKTVAENYKAVRVVYLENGPRELFDIIVTNGLLPILTLLLGYIFGTQEAASSS